MSPKAIANEAFFTLLEQELNESGRVRFRVKGYSMQPLLRNEKDEVLLIPASEKPLCVGDIALFKSNGKHILHRLLRIEGDTLVFRGDNNPKNTERCTARDVVGIVTEFYRNGKTLPARGIESPYPTLYWGIRIRAHRIWRHIFHYIYAVLAPAKHALFPPKR